MSFRLKLVLSFALLAVAAAPLPGQTLQRDPVSGDYILEFTDIEAFIIAWWSNRVTEYSPRMTPWPLRIVRGGVRLSVRVNEQRANTKQPISVFLLHPRDDAVMLSVEPYPVGTAAWAACRPFECELNFSEPQTEPERRSATSSFDSACFTGTGHDKWVFGAAPPGFRCRLAVCPTPLSTC